MCHTHAHANMHVSVPVLCAHAHARSHVGMHTHVCTYAQTCVHADTHACMHKAMSTSMEMHRIGDGIRVRAHRIYVAEEAYFVDPGWLQCGYQLWQHPSVCFERDYMAPVPTAD